MNLLYPRLRWRLLPRMLAIAAAGGAIGGLYGVLHDQITFAIGPEYFTRLKFQQFSYADFGFATRVFVAEIGFLATWWVGFLAAWFLARLAAPAWPAREAWKRCLQGFGIIFATALAAAAIGGLLGTAHDADYSNWQAMCDELKVTDIPAFVTVASIHNASYLGGLVGLLAAIAWLLIVKRRGLVNPVGMEDARGNSANSP